MSIKVEKLTLWSNRTNVRAARTPQRSRPARPLATIRPRRAAIEKEERHRDRRKHQGKPERRGAAQRHPRRRRHAVHRTRHRRHQHAGHRRSAGPEPHRRLLLLQEQGRDPARADRRGAEHGAQAGGRHRGARRPGSGPGAGRPGDAARRPDPVATGGIPSGRPHRGRHDAQAARALQAARRSLLENFSVVIERACATASSAWSIRTSRPSA